MTRALTVARAGAAAGLTGAVVVVSMVVSDAPAGDRAAAAVLHGLQVAVPSAVAILVLARRPGDRFAGLLLASALAWSLLALTDVPDAVPYSLGRVAYWLVEAGLVVLILAYPSGRLPGAAERATAVAAIALVVLLYLPTALLTTGYLAFPGAACNADCPRNAFAVTDATPALVSDVIVPLRLALTIALFALATVILIRRAHAAGPLLARALSAVAAIAVLRVAAFTAFVLARSWDPDSTVTHLTGWVFLLSLPLLALSFGGGLLARALHGAVAVPRLARRLGSDATPAEVRAGLAATLEDPTLQIVYWKAGRTGRWVDAAGWPVAAPERTPQRDVTELRADDALLGAIVHDATLAQDPAVMDAAASLAVVTLRNGDLVEDLRASLDELRESRARLAAVADETRRRIERDLHDGAQQRLVALRLRLAAESERLATADGRTASALADLRGQVDEAIDEIRTLASGIYPTLLAERGLEPALAALALSAPIETTVVAKAIGRYPPEIESAVYFTCAEAVQNAVKHAGGARHIAIALWTNETLRFEVADDGPGGASPNGKLTHLRDRIVAVGGELLVDSGAERGTRLRGRVPVA